jgi:hypothetical protein
VLAEERTVAVRVITTPPGARAIFDGRPLEALTPVVIPAVQVAEDHVLVMDADGYETLIFPFKASSESQMELEVDLRPLDTRKLGTLIVDSWPRGARVEIDQKFAGITPLPPLRLEAKVERMLLMRLGTLEPYLETVRLKPGEARSLSPRLSGVEEVEVDPELAENAAHLSITSDPPADVKVGSRAIGRTPLENVALLPGTHWIEFSDPSGLHHVEVASFRDREQASLNVTIPRGQLKVRCEPAAEVELNGRSLGTTPLETVVHVGNYVLTLVADGHAKTVNAQIQAGKVLEVDETCAP